MDRVWISLVYILWLLHSSCSEDLPDFQIRILNGEKTTTHFSGRVEVTINGTIHGSICDDFFNKSAAIVVCRPFGFTDGEAIAKAYFGSGSGPILFDDVECTGQETSLQKCKSSSTSDCDHTEDVGVFCYNDTNSVFKMRLQEGGTDTRLQSRWGRLEVTLSDMKWGSICDDLFNEHAARISCNHFNYTYGQRSKLARFRTGQRTYLDEVMCSGKEKTLLDCRHNSWFTHDCGREEDVGVTCFNTSVRLRGNNDGVQNVGAVEIWEDGKGWREVCDNEWDDNDAKVVCKELGYVHGKALCCSGLAASSSVDAWGKHPWSKDETSGSYTRVNCTGSETRVTDCPMVSSARSCSAMSSASVICYNTTVDKIDNSLAVRINGGSGNWGRVEIRHLGLWGKVCSRHWTDKEATVVCRMKGFKAGRAYGKVLSSKLPPWLTHVVCNGDEDDITNCTLGQWGEPAFSCPVSHVLCYNLSAEISLPPNNTGYGRVDITYDGMKGTVCSQGWTDTEAGVVCRTLGYTDGRAMVNDISPGTGPVFMSEVKCGYGHDSLFMCNNDGWEKVGTGCQDHSRDAGVRCYKNVRLSAGTHDVGVVQIYDNNKWKTVCGKYGFDNTEATIVCHELGFKYGEALPLAVFGTQRGSQIRRNMTCAGNETTLLNCTYDKIDTSCLPSSLAYASVSCFNSNATQAQKFKLEGGTTLDSNQASGRVRVFQHQTWGYICDTFWNDNAASVLCKQLGYTSGIAFKYGGRFIGPFFIREVKCNGNETSLDNCKTGSEICERHQAAGVLCYKTEAPKIQLSPPGQNKGRVEAVINGDAGRICADGWGNYDARVACNQLGFSYGVALKYPRGSSSSVYMSQMKCSGREESLFRCVNAGWPATVGDKCLADDAQDAGVFCFSNVRVRHGSVGKNMAVGRLSMKTGNTWNPICADSFDDADSRVACRDMGFSRSKILRVTRSVRYPNYVTQLQCTGHEPSLVNCTHTKATCPFKAGQARVLCFEETPNSDIKFSIQNGKHGRVLVERYGLNGTICEENWNDTDADVLCKEKGFAGGIKFGTVSSSLFDLVWFSDVNCTGEEDSLIKCSMKSTVSSKCRDSKTSAGVLCYSSTGVAVRLSGGEKHFGRVEIQYDGKWGSVCDYAWSRYDARALCRQLGYVEGIAYARSRYGRGSGPVYLDDMRCRVDDQSIFSCPNRGWNNSARYCRDHDNDAGVYCFPRVRLEPKSEFGAVEVWTGFSYTLVCADGFGDKEATVVCRQMGYVSGKSVCCSAFGTIDRNVAITNVKCGGSESSLLNCSHELSFTECTSHQYASVVCSNLTDNTGAYALKLDNSTRGRVSVKYFSQQGYICSDGFDDFDAKVVCKEAGFKNGGFSYKYYLNQKNKMVDHIRWLSNVDCTGNENLLDDCKNTTWGQVADCSPLSEAAAFCYKKPGIQSPTFRLQDGTNIEGRIEVNINGTWGSICGLHMDDKAASIICRHLGFPSGVSIIPGSKGAGKGPVWINSLHCSGNETSLFDCPLTGMGDPDSKCRSHLFDGAVMCYSKARLAGDVISKRHDYGRLEVSINDTWVAVCDTGFNEAAVEVACRQLGFKYGKRQCCSALGPTPKGMRIISSIQCAGNEADLTSCKVDTTNCSSGNYVAVVCNKKQFQDGFRLGFPHNSFFGMLNVSRNNVWGAICAAEWVDGKAASACRELGYLNGVAVAPTDLEDGFPIIMGHINCNSKKGNLSGCYHDGFDDSHGCEGSRKGASVLCTDSARGIQYRLAPGFLDKGQAQVFFEGKWGLVSRLDFGKEEASVFCKSLGYVGGEVMYMSGVKRSSESIVISYVECDGTEKAFHHCKATWDPDRNRYISSTFAVSVECFRAVRLEKGKNETSGIVKVYHDGQWGIICADNFDDNAAGAVCRELGHEQGIALCCSPYGFNFDEALIEQVQCANNESSILNCKFKKSTKGRPSCSRQNYASVVCYNGTRTNNFTVGFKGSLKYTGEVVVDYMGVTGRICSSGWDDHDAEVMCRQLGFSHGISYTHYKSSFSYFGYTGPYWTSDVNCTGSETDFAKCLTVPLGTVKKCTADHFAGALCINTEGIFYRLADGGDQWGRVEVAIDGKWGTLCDRYWDKKETEVLCRALGFTDGDPIYGKFNRTGSGNVWEANIRCQGKEEQLNDCPHEGWISATTGSCAGHRRDAGAFCYTSVKLSTGVGRSIKHGAVLLNQNNTWHRVCDQGFTDKSAKIVCQTLGFKDGRAICCSAYGPARTTTSMLKNITLKCTGEETDVSECIVEEECNSNYYASVVCSKTPDEFHNSTYTMSMKGQLEGSGQLRLTHWGVEGRICSRDWDDNDALVYCKSQRYTGGVAYQHSHVDTYTPERSLGPFWFSSVNCTGSEKNIMDCPHDGRMNLGNCTNSHTASVLCFNESGIEYRLRGGTKYFGRVEISVGGQWGTICDNYWDRRDATVFCRQQGFNEGEGLTHARYGQGSGPIWLSHMQCTGKEKALHQCPHRGFKERFSRPSQTFPFIFPCSDHQDDASVFCYKNARLNQKFGSDMGGLEIFSPNGSKFGVCDTGFDDTAAKVACRSLGLNYTDGRLIKGSAFGNISGPILYTRVTCTGTEKDIKECDLQTSGSCASKHYVSVFCSKTHINDTGFEMRLASDGLSRKYHGIIEVKKNGVWGRVCMQGWDDKDADVSCRQLGFRGGVAYLHIVKNTKAMLMRNFQCLGTESLLSECKRNETSDVEHCSFDANDAGVLCFEDTGVKFRLYGGANSSYGRVEIGYDNQWGSLCSWAWSTKNSKVFCNMLGYQDGIPGAEGMSKLETNRYFLNGAFCNGAETSLLTCLNSGFNSSLLAYLCKGEAYSTCFNTDVKVLNVTLSGGPTPGRGRVEIFLSGANSWGTVCDDYWDNVDAGVVCRQLGYDGGIALPGGAYGPGTGSIWMDNVECRGDESSIADCKNRGLGTHNCNHSEDASVECFMKTTLPPVIVTTPRSTPLSTVSTSTQTQTTSTTTTASTTPTTATSTTTTTTQSTTPTSTSSTQRTTSRLTTTTLSTTRTTTTTFTSSSSTQKTSTVQGVGTSSQKKNYTNIIVGVSVPILLLMVIVIVLAVIFWKMRKTPKTEIPHERFHDDVIEQTLDGSIAMRNQMFDFNMANGDTVDPLSESSKYMAEDSEISISNNGYAHFSKSPQQNANDAGFSNPLYGTVNDTQVDPAHVSLDVDDNQTGDTQT